VSNYNFKKGITFGSIGVFLIGLQPVISNARPSIIDPFIFAAMTALVEALIFLHKPLQSDNDLISIIGIKNYYIKNGWNMIL